MEKLGAHQPLWSITASTGKNGNNTRIDDCWNYCLKETSELSINLYPNPAELAITIDIFNLLDVSDLLIYNSLGHAIKQTVITKENNTYIINLQNFSTGIYFIKIVDKENNSLKSTKFIKL
ncbi:T9SS type A sorting domain-containing protein [Vicingaceae bacterium]|nr:T9SS type A sorting domain-containing protein [Vicingaceae bacterium]